MSAQASTRDSAARGDAIQAEAGLALALPAAALAQNSRHSAGNPHHIAGNATMSQDTITTQDGTRIFYKDWGSGRPIVFHHGWPLSSDDWDAQMLFFLSKGFRVIAHDRRGHGRSSQTDKGNEMDTYAADVAALVAHLDLQDAIHVGHSTG